MYVLKMPQTDNSKKRRECQTKLWSKSNCLTIKSNLSRISNIRYTMIVIENQNLHAL